MKLSALVGLAAVGLVLASGAVGCKKRPTGVTPIPGGARVGESGPIGPNPGDQAGVVKPTDGAAPTAIPGQGYPMTNDFSGWKEDRETFSTQTVYFDLDKFVVKPSEMPKVEAVAARMKTETGKAVRVEGHCDERGTEEYNRALGERRAQAVREALVTLGILPNRIDTISYGEDRPAVQGHDESAWSKNRRGQFILLSPPSP
jgi:peptidoglycan-associated lipoprotein